MRHQNDAPPSSRLEPKQQILTSFIMATVQVHSKATNTFSRQPENDIGSKCLVVATPRQPTPTPPSPSLSSSQAVRKEINDKETTNNSQQNDESNVTWMVDVHSTRDKLLNEFNCSQKRRQLSAKQYERKKARTSNRSKLNFSHSEKQPTRELGSTSKLLNEQQIPSNRLKVAIEVTQSQYSCSLSPPLDTSRLEEEVEEEEVANEEDSTITQSTIMTATTTTSIKPPLESPATPADELSQQSQQDDTDAALLDQITDTSLSQVLERPQQPHRRRPINSMEKHGKLSDTQLDCLNTLIKMIRNGDYDEFLDLIERRQLKNLLNVFVDGQTALHYTLIYGRGLTWCKQLILNGANPNLTNRAGWHPVHLAAFNGSRETLRYLIDCIAN